MPIAFFFFFFSGKNIRYFGKKTFCFVKYYNISNGFLFFVYEKNAIILIFTHYLLTSCMMYNNFQIPAFRDTVLIYIYIRVCVYTHLTFRCKYYFYLSRRIQRETVRTDWRCLINSLGFPNGIVIIMNAKG